MNHDIALRKFLICRCGGFEKSRLRRKKKKKEAVDINLLAAGVLGHSLRSFADCVFAQLAGQVKADGCLDLTAGDGVLLVVVGQAGRFGGDALEDVVHEGVHDAHGLAGDAGVGVDLLQDLVDVDRVALLAGFPLLLFPSGLGGLGGRGFLLALLCGYFARHDARFCLSSRTKVDRSVRRSGDKPNFAPFYVTLRIVL